MPVRHIHLPFLPLFGDEGEVRPHPRKPRTKDHRDGFSWKRALDLGVTLAILPGIVVLVCAVAIWIKLVSRGPAFFRQQRVGRSGRVFHLYKLRSMEVGACATVHRDHVRRLFKMKRPMKKLDCMGDPRFIRGGRFLRSTGLDELPQLLNVLSGEMSLVGPRPCLPYEYRYYSGCQRRRFDARPGLTGYWQVSGRNRVTFRRMSAMDLYYARNASMLLDLSILLKTPVAVSRQMLDDWSRRDISKTHVRTLPRLMKGGR